jgi:hypothetical protein
MNVADTCASLVALPIAWALLRLKNAIPAAPERHYRCTLARPLVAPPDPQLDADDEVELVLPLSAHVFWLPCTDITYEHYIH